MEGNDTVIFIAESASLLNSRITRLPQVITVEIPAPGMAERQHFISWFNNTPKLVEKPLNLWGNTNATRDAHSGLIHPGTATDAPFRALFRGEIAT